MMFQMATFSYTVLFAACLSITAYAFPDEPVVHFKNTIFGDERLEGEIFEDLAESEEVIITPLSTNAYRLPTTTRPIHYDVLWLTNMTDLSLYGEVDIQLYATQANVNEIVIHVHELDILDVELRQGNTIINQSFVLQNETHFMRVQLSDGYLQYNPTNRVDYVLSIRFQAEFRNDMYGIYRSWFRPDSNGTDISWMASTQFQATSARSAFPCYDEPSFKATFDITIRRPADYYSWSCTRISDTVNSTIAGYQDDVYYRTPIMSTYLLALIVAQYDSLREPQTGILRYEVIARPEALADGQGDYAFEVGQDLLALMSNHTDYDFFDQSPYLKMTQAAIPDFSAGAMENWGLLTYREAYLMYSEEHTNGYFKQLIAYILSHEIAHMWFGNLVTCDWWDVLWLNEGFARYYQYFLTHWVEDYLGLETRFITEQIHTSLLSDSANNPQPLTNPGVGSPSSVSAMFSTISYNKGAAVIRMTEHLLGFAVHEQGLRNYLRNRQFGMALPIDLFNELEAAGRAAGALNEYGSDFSLVEYYRSWTEQPGHPVLNVQVNHQTGEMLVFQRRFNINTGYSSANNHYIVPITFATASNPDFDNTKPTHVVSETVTVLNRGSVGDEWVVFNKQQTGFYRVNYDDYTWNLNVLALRSANRTLIHEFNRAQIVNDVFQFARSGLMTHSRAFNILSFLANETDYAPWMAAITGFNWLRNRYAATAVEPRLEALIDEWAATAIANLTYYPQENESFMRSYLRYQLAPVLCSIGNENCINAAVDQFRALRDNNTEVPADSRNWVYCNALRHGSEADFDFLWRRFQSHHVYTEKIQLLMVLGCTPHPSSLETFVSHILEENYIIRPQDYTTALNSAVTGNENNTQIVFNIMRSNFSLVLNAFSNPATPLSYISSRLRTEQEILEFQQWATENSDLLGAQYQSVINSANLQRENIAWAVQVQDDVLNYLNNGDEVITVTDAPVIPPVEVVTEAQPPLVNPPVPELPDSAASTFVSMFAMAIAAVAYVLV